MRWSLVLVATLQGCSGAEPPAEEPPPQAPAAEAPEAAEATAPEAEVPEAEVPEAEVPEAAEGAAPEADQPAQGEVALADPCPVLGSDDRRGGGVAPSVNGEDVATDLEALEATVPERVAGLRRRGVDSWGRGDAGHWSPGVSASFAYQDDDLTIGIDDLVHVCSCDEGMGEVLRGRQLQAMEEARSHEVAGHPAVLVAERPNNLPNELRVWVNDRCKVRVSGYAPVALLQNVAGALDWPGLASACPAL